MRIQSPDPLSRLDEAIAALKVVDPTCTPPTYMIGDLQWIGSVLGFRSNSRGYLRHMATKAVNSRGDVLECGSGLSSLLLAVTAGRQGHHVHTFEHDASCHEKLLRLVDRYRLSNITVHHAPFSPTEVSTGMTFHLHVTVRTFNWLSATARSSFNRQWPLWMFPVMRDRLNPHCRVIMDDSNRSLERHVIHRWRKEQHIEVHSFGALSAVCGNSLCLKNSGSRMRDGG